MVFQVSYSVGQFFEPNDGIGIGLFLRRTLVRW